MKWNKRWYRDYGPPPWSYWREEEHFRHHRRYPEEVEKEDYREWLLEKKRHLEEKIKEIEAELKALEEES